MAGKGFSHSLGNVNSGSIPLNFSWFHIVLHTHPHRVQCYLLIETHWIRLL